MRIIIYLVLTFVLIGCSAQNTQYLSRPIKLNVPGTFVHHPSGMMFPETIGELERGSIHRFDKQGLNVSVEYNLHKPEKPLAATVYISPSTSITSIGSPPSVIQTAHTHLCQREFDNQKQNIMRAHPDAQAINEHTSTSQQGGGVHIHSATFEYEGVLAGVRQPLKSRLNLNCYLGGKWTLKYRFTYPPTADVKQELDAFKMEHPWTKTLLTN